MRPTLLLLLCCFSLMASAQQNNHAQIQYLLREKMHGLNPHSALNYLKTGDIRFLERRVASVGNLIQDRSADIIVHDDNKAESEVHAAINPADSANIIAAAVIQDATNALNPLSLGVHYSKNFAQSWQKSTINFNPGGGFVAGGGDPVVAFDKSGKAYLSWLVLTLGLDGLKLTLYASVSTNKGQTWGAAVKVDEGSASLDVVLGGSGTGSLVDKQWMATDQSTGGNEGALYVSYTRFNIMDSITSGQILLKKKPKSVNVFGTSVQVHQNNYPFTQFSSIDVDAQGNVHVTFCAGTTENDIALYHAVSVDGGLSFLPETKISPIYFPQLINQELEVDTIPGVQGSRLYPCPHVKVGKNNGVLYAAWTANGFTQALSPDYDVWFSKSVNGGQNWSAPKRVNASSAALTQQFYSALTVNGQGDLHISYYDRNNSGTETHYVVSTSTDEGESFAPVQQASTVASDFAQIGNLNGGFGIGEYTQIVCTDHFAIPIWSDGRSNNGDIDIYAAILSTSGQASDLEELGNISDAFQVKILNNGSKKLIAQVELKQMSDLNFSLYNADARLIQEFKQPEAPAGAFEQRFNLNQNGVFFLKIETEFGFKIKKIIISE